MPFQSSLTRSNQGLEEVLWPGLGFQRESPIKRDEASRWKTQEIMTDQELIASFESGSIPATAFHHADHVRTAFAYLRHYPVLEALQRFSAGLKHFAKAQGKENLYHETITWAYLFLINERISRAAHSLSWEQFASDNPDLLTWKNSVLRRYYTDETLRSNLAKQLFVFPDKLA
jgi:hypothetical protein